MRCSLLSSLFSVFTEVDVSRVIFSKPLRRHSIHEADDHNRLIGLFCKVQATEIFLLSHCLYFLEIKEIFFF